MKIMLVDDSNTMRKIQHSTLDKLGMFSEIHEACDGKEALEKLQETAVDYVLLDWNMPNMTGLEALKAIRADPKLKGIKVIMCTSESKKENVVEAVQAGANNYVVKPFTPDILKEKIEATK